MNGLWFTLVLSALVRQGAGVSSACGQSPSFEQYVSAFGRTYTGDEYASRRATFEQRVGDIEAQNCRAGGRRWHAAVNLLSDRSNAELAGMRGRSHIRHADVARPSSFLQAAEKKRAPLPMGTSVNYGHLEAMKQIRDQGSCGSCWAVATTTMLRAHRQMYNGDDKAFSMQQLLSCVPNPESCGGDGGCKGATGELALDYVIHNGLEDESKNGYKGVTGTCASENDAKSKKPVPQPLSGNGTGPASLWGMIGWVKLPENEKIPLERAVYEKGPVAVSVAADYSWNSYNSGILDSCSKNNVINHLVTLTGFGGVGGTNYWTIQNSWGRGWGEQGSMRLLREDDEKSHCGWDTTPLDGTGCKGGPSKVWICGQCGILYDSVVPDFTGKTKEALTMIQRRLSA